ncbi:MAG TPA: hypothetical protein PLP29_10695 [Candidatus Ozemobacteraceae bacterium]|nr:hypothetical protein [Candidatus Ozemobacteraceae bacterium]
MTRASRPQTSVGDLLDRTQDDEALDELVKIKAAAATSAAARLRKLKPGLSVEAGWLCRVVSRVAEDPFKILLPLLPGIDYPKDRTFSIAAHGWARPKDRRRILEMLKELVPAAFTASDDFELPDSIGQYAGATGLAILLEALARLEPASVREPARALFAAAQKLLPRPSKKPSFASQSRKVDLLPLIAASAAALLVSAAAATAREREAWESACVRAALDPAMDPDSCSFGPPLAFLFVGAPDLAGRLIAQLMNEADEPDRILRQIGATLREARRMGFPLPVAMPTPGEGETAQKLEAMVGQAAEWGVFADIPAWAAMEIRRSLNPETVVPDALCLFRDAMIGTSLIRDALDQLDDLVKPATFPAIAVETMFAYRTSESHFASVREAAERRVNERLKRAGMKPFKGFAWCAPPGKRRTVHELDTLEALEEALRSVYEAIHEAAQQPGTAPSGKTALVTFLRSVFPHTLCRHAIYRNLVCEMARLPEERYPDLLALLPEPEMERDAGMIRMIAKWSDLEAPEPFNALLVCFLDHRLVLSDMGLLEKIVTCLARAPKDSFLEPLKSLKQHLEEDVPTDTPNRYGALQAVDELLLSLGNADSVADVPRKVSVGALVTTEEKMTMLRLAATGKIELDQKLFEKLFSEAIESEHLTWTGWTAAITGRQVREYILKILRDRSSPHPKVVSVAKYCFWARKDGIPALALIPILERLGPAVEAARNSPGETWEDRNWGGYTTSGAEDLADALSLAVKGFLEADCRAVGWTDLVTELSRAATGDLRKIPTGESASCGFTFSVLNFLTRLASKLARLNDPALTRAMEALRNMYSGKDKTPKST